MIANGIRHMPAWHRHGLFSPSASLYLRSDPYEAEGAARHCNADFNAFDRTVSLPSQLISPFPAISGFYAEMSCSAMSLKIFKGKFGSMRKISFFACFACELCPMDKPFSLFSYNTNR
jgi:hypothetical protein